MQRIKDFITEVKEVRKEARYTQIIKKESKKFDSFRYDPQEMLRHGIDFAGIIYDGDGYHFVYNAKFGLFDIDVQAFIVLHELGHMELGHLLIPDIAEERILRAKMGYAHSSELEADSYAASILGKKLAVKALKAQTEWAIDLAKPELEFRIREISRRKED